MEKNKGSNLTLQHSKIEETKVLKQKKRGKRLGKGIAVLTPEWGLINESYSKYYYMHIIKFITTFGVVN
jgi:hypothetical protein